MSLEEGQRSLLCPPPSRLWRGGMLGIVRARRRIPLQKSWKLEMGSLIHFRDHHEASCLHLWILGSLGKG